MSACKACDGTGEVCDDCGAALNNVSQECEKCGKAFCAISRGGATLVATGEKCDIGVVDHFTGHECKV